MKTTITVKNNITETSNQIVTHMDGTEGIIERENVVGYYNSEMEVNVIFGGSELGYGFKENDIFIFAGVADLDLNFCKKVAGRFDYPKWDKNLNLI